MGRVDFAMVPSSRQAGDLSMSDLVAKLAQARARMPVAGRNSLDSSTDKCINSSVDNSIHAA